MTTPSPKFNAGISLGNIISVSVYIGLLLVVLTQLQANDRALEDKLISILDNQERTNVRFELELSRQTSRIADQEARINRIAVDSARSDQRLESIAESQLRLEKQLNRFFESQGLTR